MRIVTYNVRYFGHATRGIVSTKRTVLRIAAAIAALDPLPELVCLQEVETASIRSTVAHPRAYPSETQLDRLMLALDDALHVAKKKAHYEAYYFPAHRYAVVEARPFYTTGLAILARGDVAIDHHNAEAPIDITHRHLHPIRKLKQTRICAHIRFRLPRAGMIDVFNTHLSLPSTLSREFWTLPERLGYGPNQVAEAKNLARFVERERKSDAFVVVGDFNALPGSPVYRYLTDHCGYTDGLASAYRLGEIALKDWPTAGFMRLRMHLDHVFGGKALEWTDFAESAPFGEKQAMFHGLSDHVPLIGRCRVRAAS